MSASAPTTTRRPDARELTAVFFGGFVGAIARVALSDAVASDPGSWPWATFAANVAGALALACFVILPADRSPLRLRLLGTGFCGALTTFSTLQLELLNMLDTQHVALAAGYAAASVTAGLAAVALVSGLARRARSASAP